LVGLQIRIPSGGVDDCILAFLCVVKYRSPRRADHSSRGVLQIVMCLSVIMKPSRGSCVMGKIITSGDKEVLYKSLLEYCLIQLRSPD